MFAAAVTLFEDAMMDPDREKRQQIRAIISGKGEQIPDDWNGAGQVDTGPEQTPRSSPKPRTGSPPGPDENPFGDGVFLPPDFKEQPLG